MVKQKRPIVFIHVPRTGGTSLHELLTKNLDNNNVCPARFYFDLRSYSEKELEKYRLFSGHFGTEDCKLIHKPRYVTLLRDPIDRVISLYALWHAQAGIYSGTLQSDQNYAGVQLAMHSTLDKFVRTTDPVIFSKISNTQSRFILSGLGQDAFYENMSDDAAHKVIKKLENEFVWYGTIEQLSRRTDDFWRSLHSGMSGPISVPHLNQKSVYYIDNHHISQDTIDYIKSINQIDQAIYEYVTENSWQEVPSLVKRLMNLSTQRIGLIRGAI